VINNVSSDKPASMAARAKESSSRCSNSSAEKRNRFARRKKTANWSFSASLTDCSSMV
jgi:hypothetical protein